MQSKGLKCRGLFLPTSRLDLRRHSSGLWHMTNDRDPDQHLDDEEARLLADLALAWRDLNASQATPPGETYSQRLDREQRARNACAEIDRLQQALDASLASYVDPDATDPRDRDRTPPILPLLPGPPSWRTSVLSYHGAAAEEVDRARADAIIEAAARDALAVLQDRPRAEPPRVVAMQVLDHFVARDEVTLPPYGLDLLARAMRIDPRQIEALQRRAAIARGEAAGRSQKAIAENLGISTRAVRLLRDRSVPPDVATYAAILEGHDIRALRPQVASALGLIDADTGRWRATVLDTIRGGGAGARIPGRVREAARVEARRRQSGLQPNDAKRLAMAMGIGVSTVERIIARPNWELNVVGEAIWLRGGLRARPRERNPAADL